MFSQPQGERGAYGLRIAGVVSARLQPASAEWPQLTVERATGAETAPEPPGTVTHEEGSVRIWIAGGGTVDVDRAALRVRVQTPAPLSDDAIVHPYLALPAAFAGRWLGRHALHGGAFVHGDGAWALLGDKGGGKSSTLAALMRRGHGVLTDDVLVLDGLGAFAGPRAVDLREPAAAALGGEALGVVGARARWRLEPAPVPPVTPLRGVIHLGWGEELAVVPLDAADRLTGLIAQCALRPEREDALELLELAALPAWRLERPQRMDALDACVDQLLELVAG